jgi:hypothetical protein
VLGAVAAHRLQNLRISLNPMINNLNYATNVPELYESIFANWAALLSKEIALFRSCGRFDLVRTITVQLMADLLPKIEKSIFKVKELVAIVRIRKSYSDFLLALNRVPEWQGEEKLEVSWEAVSSAVAKCEVLIGARLTEEA